MTAHRSFLLSLGQPALLSPHKVDVQISHLSLLPQGKPELITLILSSTPRMSVSYRTVTETVGDMKPMLNLSFCGILPRRLVSSRMIQTNSQYIRRRPKLRR